MHLRDGDAMTTERVRRLQPKLFLSIISRVELENGIYADPKWTGVRRAALDILLTEIGQVDFGDPELDAYRQLVTEIGYSRRKVIDRMIAATAIANGLTLITMNGTDFLDIKTLQLEVWPSPEA